MSIESVLIQNTQGGHSIIDISKTKEHPFEVLILKKVNPMEQFMNEGQRAEP